MATSFDEVDRLAVDTIRTLAMDAVQAADSGHPGTPMALAPVAYLLYTRFLRHDPADPAWPDRDRFVLSCGHASMLQYAILHLTGYDLPLDELEAFRQWGSRTPGHPEVGLVPGVEITTGPLGQGCGASVGMAFAERHLAAVFNRPDGTVVDHRTWVVCSDGDLMEGLSSEAASLAGHLGLGRLVWIWDDNRITIEGGTHLTFREDVPRRFETLGWRTLEVADVNDLDSLAAALAAAADDDGRPTLVRVQSHIAFGAPGKQGTAEAHGAPLGEDEVRGAKLAYGWPPDARFLVPEEVRGRCDQRSRGAGLQRAWRDRLEAWRAVHPELAAEWRRRMALEPVPGWADDLPAFAPDDGPIATRAASGRVLNALAERLPELLGGSADLGSSCKTILSGSGSVGPGAFGERNLHFGIREHAMAAFVGGACLHGGLRPYGSTFLVFADYMRPSIRLSALMEQPAVWVFTHDSVWVGEDGPTHQPIEHLLSLRAIPGLVVLRPADANETAAAWRIAVARTDGPTALVLSRQKVPVLATTAATAVEGVPRGAYVVHGAPARGPDLVLVASGSEVALAVAAAERLEADGVAVRVVSMPSWELFDRQDEGYRRAVLPPEVPAVAVEAGLTRGWREYLGPRSAVVGIDRFGASAPGRVVAEKLGLNVDNVVEVARGLL